MERTEEEDESEEYMGELPNKNNKKELTLSLGTSQRIQAWLKNGLSKDRREKLKVLDTISRKGANINLEPPNLDDEIEDKALITNDHFLKDYANLASGALAASAHVYDAILNDNKKQVNRSELMSNLAASVKLLSHLCHELTNARRYKIINSYSENTQKIMKKTEPSTLLFDGKLTKLAESHKALEKSRKDLQPKKSVPTFPRANRPLNWEGPPNRRKAGGPINYRTNQRSSGSRSWQPPANRTRPYSNVRKTYSQTQPQQNQRR